MRQNVRRVNRHPSNVQWAGGNEIEGIVLGSGSAHYLDEVSSFFFFFSEPAASNPISLQFLFLFQDFLQKIVVSETRSVGVCGIRIIGNLIRRFT